MSNYAFLAFTDRGAALAEKLCRALGGSLTAAHGDPEFSLHDWTAANFPRKDALIFVGATGIAVRAVAPFLQSKATDPAVITLDEAGRYVIPLVSGHLGGANALAKEVAALCGGACYGLAAATLVRGQVAGSGSDLLGRMLITKFRVLTLGTFVMLVDAVVILLSILTFGNLETGIYAGLSIVVCSFVTDAIINGNNKAYMFQIITQVDADYLAEQISRELDRGVTLIPAKGMYRKEDRNMLLVVVSRRQVYAMKDVIKAHAPDAFVVLVSANEIMGEGFKGLDVTVPIKELEAEREKKEG